MTFQSSTYSLSFKIFFFLFLKGLNKFFDPAHIDSALRFIQSLSASENEVQQRLLENCRRAGLKVHGHTPADGNCFFHAIADQLSLLGLPHQSAVQLRNNVTSFLEQHPQVRVGKTCSILAAAKGHKQIYLKIAVETSAIMFVSLCSTWFYWLVFVGKCRL